MRRVVAILAFLILTVSAAASGAAAGPPVGGCPAGGGWTLRDADEPGAPPIDLNGDGVLCGKEMTIPAHPGIDNYIDNVVPPTL